MTDYTFIKDSTLLEEDHRVEDLLDFSANINDLTEQLVRIKNNSTVGLIGPYGCGKSTLLYQIHEDGKYNKDREKDNSSGNEEKSDDKDNADAGENDSNLDGVNNSDKEESVSDKEISGAGESVRNLAKVRDATWFTFDAWKYPERKDLWDGFVIDIAMQMSAEQLKKVKTEINGKKNWIVKISLKIFSAVVKTLALANMVPGVGYLTGAVQGILGDTLSSPPIKRVYEFQGLLKKLLNNIKEDIYIVVEDVDRSGDQGIFFLETLRHFIKNIKSEHKIIVIVPMGEEVFRKQDNNMARDSYLKVLDYQLKFNPGDIKFDKFIQETIEVEKFVTKYQSAPREHTEILFYFFGHAILANGEGTIRDIKHLLRLADNSYSILKESDNERIEPMLVLFFIASEYFHTKNSKVERYYFEKIPHGIGGRYENIDMQQKYVIHSTHWLYDFIRFYFNKTGSKALDRNFKESKPSNQYFCLSFSENYKIPAISLYNSGSIFSNFFADRDKVNVIDISHKYLRLIPGQLI